MKWLELHEDVRQKATSLDKKLKVMHVTVFVTLQVPGGQVEVV